MPEIFSNAEIFLVRLWIQRFTLQISIFSSNKDKNTDQQKIRIWAPFMQCHLCVYIINNITAGNNMFKVFLLLALVFLLLILSR